MYSGSLQAFFCCLREARIHFSLHAALLPHCQPPQRCKSSSSSDNQSEPQQVIVRQEEKPLSVKSWAINWPRLKRSWVFFQKHLACYKFPFPASAVDGLQRMRKDNHILYYFRDAKDLDYWYVNTDEEVGGYSWAELKQSSNEMTMVFRGNLNQRHPAWMAEEKPDPESYREFNGTVMLETKPFYTFYDRKELTSLESFNCVKMRIRGDGRRYWFEMVNNFRRCEEDIIPFRYPIFTRGGPLWEEIEIPYIKFAERNYKTGDNVLKQRFMGLLFIERFRFLLNDGIDGPFQLEIDYIALANNKKFDAILNEEQDYTDNHDPWQEINRQSGAC